MNAPVRIGDVALTSRVVQAPLSGYSHLPYRVLSRERGAGLVCAEMVSSRALVRGNEKTRAQLRTDPAEGAVSMQLFGNDPGEMAEADAWGVGPPCQPETGLAKLDLLAYLDLQPLGLLGLHFGERDGENAVLVM